LSLKFELITTFERFEALHDEWNALLLLNATNVIFLTWQWQSTWWQSYQPGDMWVLTARDEANTLVGIAPWFREAGSNVLRPIGCVAVTDYLDILVIPQYRELFCQGVAEHLAEHRGWISQISLCNTPGNSPTLEILPRSLAERGFAVNVREQEVCPAIMLPSDFEAYLGQLDKKQRHEARRKLRRAAENDAHVEWYIVGPGHDLEAELEKFIKLMAASDVEKTAFLDDPQNLGFFRAMVRRVAACGWLQLAFLTVSGDPAAAYLNFDYDNRILVYNSGLYPEKYGYLSVGIVLLLRLIEHAIEQGRSVFDFLRGNEEYKYRMGGKDRPVMEIQAEFGKS
jgi:CelD/BcsL family acetyltransferase involved in cellulose biosynthesis